MRKITTQSSHGSSTHKNEGRRDVLPTHDPELAGPLPQHALDVVGEPLGAVEPAHCHGLHEHDEQDGVAGAEDVKKVHDVHSALRDERN